MIAAMKVLTIVTLDEYRSETLGELQNLGVVHVSGKILEDTDINTGAIKSNTCRF